MNQTLDKWDLRFLNLAETVSTWSKDPSTQTGAVVVRPDNTIAALGYNGFPAKLNDDPKMYEDREVKYERIIHCEMNAVMNARERVEGYTLYTYPFLSCPRCAVHMVTAGIARVVAPACPEDKLDRWGDAMDRTKAIFKEAGVEIVEVNGRETE